VSGPFVASAPASTSLASLSAAQIKQLCSDIDTYEAASGFTASWFGCHYQAVVAATDAISDQGAEETCGLYYAQCTGLPTPAANGIGYFATPTGTGGYGVCWEMSSPSSLVFSPCAGKNTGSLARCTATVADLATCLNDIDTTLAAADATAPACDTLTVAAADQVYYSVAPNGYSYGIYGLSIPASCSSYALACPFVYKAPTNGMGPGEQPPSTLPPGAGVGTPSGAGGSSGLGVGQPGNDAGAADAAPPSTGRPTTPTDF
jgi:hypothetical protein